MTHDANFEESLPSFAHHDRSNYLLYLFVISPKREKERVKATTELFHSENEPAINMIPP